jgi:mannose-6-phosphate isomerase
VLVEDQTQTLLQKLDGQPLPFLLKLLAADSPLSIQVHPNSAQAAAGFARENAAGIDLLAANRNYKDDRHKPELLVALSDGFEALCGFARTEQIIRSFDALASVADLKTEDQLGAFTDLIETAGIEALFDLLIHLSGEQAAELELGIAAAAARARLQPPRHVYLTSVVAAWWGAG